MKRINNEEKKNQEKEKYNIILFLFVFILLGVRLETCVLGMPPCGRVGDPDIACYVALSLIHI